MTLPTDAEVAAMAERMGVPVPVQHKDRARVVKAILEMPTVVETPAERDTGVTLSSTISTLPDGSKIVVEVTHFPKATS